MRVMLKHPAMRDVAMEVFKSFYIKEKDAYSLKVVWWNIGPHKPFCMNIAERLTISAEKLREFQAYDLDAYLKVHKCD